MTTLNGARRSVAENLSEILASPEVSRLVDELRATRWTGRPGYPLRAMIGMALAKSLYAIPTWTRTAALVREHPALAAVIAPDGDVPSVYACYRFTAKLHDHAHLLDGCIADVIGALKKQNPILGWDVAIDASDMPAYANGQRFASKGGRERSTKSSPTPTRPGAIGRLSRRARVAVSTATVCTWRCAPRRTCRSHGESKQERQTKCRPSPACSTNSTCTGSIPRHARWTRGTTQGPPMTLAPTGGSLRWSRSVRHPPSSAVSTSRRVVSTASGSSREPTRTRRHQVALSNRRMQARFHVDQSRPSPSTDPEGDNEVERSLPASRVRRASVRSPQERMGTRTIACASYRACTPSRRPHDPFPTCDFAERCTGSGCISRIGLRTWTSPRSTGALPRPTWPRNCSICSHANGAPS